MALRARSVVSNEEETEIQKDMYSPVDVDIEESLDDIIFEDDDGELYTREDILDLAINDNTYWTLDDDEANAQLQFLREDVSHYYRAQRDRIAYGNQIFSAFMYFIGVKPGESCYDNSAFRQIMGIPDNIKDAKKLKQDKLAKILLEYIQKEYKSITKAIAEFVYGKQKYKLYNENNILYTAVNQLTVSRLERAFNKIFNKHENNFRFITNIIIYNKVRDFNKYANIEAQIKSEIEKKLKKFEIWQVYLSKVHGSGTMLSASLMAKIKPRSKVTQIWAYAGYDTVLNPTTGLREGRTNGFRKGKEHHRVKRIDKKAKSGELIERDSISYNPFIKTTCYKLSGSFIKKKNPFYRSLFDDYKNRIAARDIEYGVERTPNHMRLMAFRYMSKMFLQDFWVHYAIINKVVPEAPYADEKLQHQSHIRTLDLSFYGPEDKKGVMVLVDWPYITERYHPDQKVDDFGHAIHYSDWSILGKDGNKIPYEETKPRYLTGYLLEKYIPDWMKYFSPVVKVR